MIWRVSYDKKTFASFALCAFALILEIMLNIETPEIKYVIHAVRQASRLVKQIQAEMVSPALTKDDRSPVTVADFAAQALVGHLLDKNFPDDPLVGEEDSSALHTPEEQTTLERITAFVSRFTAGATPETVCQWIDRGTAISAPRFWTIDPIDGTKGFLRGDQYAVALALIEEGQVQIGALGCPNLSPLSLQGRGVRACTERSRIGEGVLIVAARGQGTWAGTLDGELDLRPLSVSERSGPAQARLLRSLESGHTHADQIERFSEAFGVQADPLRMDSQAKYAVLAAGQAEIYLRLLSPKLPDYREKIWDQAAGTIVIEEAGGRVTDLDGRALDFTRGRTLTNNRGICATNGVLHEAVLESLKIIGA